MPDAAYVYWTAAAVIAAVIAAYVWARAAERRMAERQAQDAAEMKRFIEDNLRAATRAVYDNAANERRQTETRLRDESMQVSSRVDALGQRLDASSAQQDDKWRALSLSLQQHLTANDEKVERLRDTLHRRLADMQRDNGEKLEKMRQTVDERLQQTLNKRLGESFSLVNERLEQVYKGLGEMRTLAGGVGDLKKVLTNVKTRGIWGEMQLGTLISEALPEDKYEVNAAVKPGTQERVEYAIRLPGKQDGQLLYLPVDAKFPIESYTRLVKAQEAGDKEPFDAAKKAFEQDLLREANRIASKYIAPPYTTDFAVMYLPLEGLYAQALQAGEAAERIRREHRIMIAGPSTFYALLSSLQMGFRTLAIEQRSGEAWKLLGQAKQELSGFAEILDKSLQKLRQAGEGIESATRRTRTIVRHLKDVEDAALPAGDAEQPPDAGEG